MMDDSGTDSKAAEHRRTHDASREVENLLLGVFDAASFTDHGHANLAGVLQLLLDSAGDTPSERKGLVIGQLLGLDHDAQFAAGLHRKTFFHATK